MKITPKQAAELMEVCPQFVRLGMQQQRLPIGTAVKISTRWTYHISVHLLSEYLGISETEIERRLA